MCLFLFSACFGRLCAHSFHSTLHTRQSSIQSDKCQELHRYSYCSWWWAHSRLKHVGKRNKHTKKNCAPSWLYLQELCYKTDTSKICIQPSDTEVCIKWQFYGWCRLACTQTAHVLWCCSLVVIISPYADFSSHFFV